MSLSISEWSRSKSQSDKCKPYYYCNNVVHFKKQYWTYVSDMEKETCNDEEHTIVYTSDCEIVVVFDRRGACQDFTWIIDTNALLYVSQNMNLLISYKANELRSIRIRNSSK